MCMYVCACARLYTHTPTHRSLSYIFLYKCITLDLVFIDRLITKNIYVIKY